MDTKNLRTMLLALAALGTALAAPVHANKPAGGAATCALENLQDGASNADGDHIYCQVALGPENLDLKSLAGANQALCLLTQHRPPHGCSGVQWNSFLAAGGVYDVNTATNGPHQLTAWVVQSAGLCGIQGFGCGFEIILCNDVDLDRVCTNIDDDSDQFKRAQSNEPILGGGYLLPHMLPFPGDLPCIPTITCPGTSLPTIGGVCDDDGDGGSQGDKDDDKDTKNCGTDNDALASFCGKPVEAGVSPDNWHDGQIAVFIGAWADAWVGWRDVDGLPTNIGLGISAGTFDAWFTLTTPETCDNTLDLPECDDDKDNDGNGATDYPADPGCTDFQDTDEASGPITDPTCANSIDDDGDFFVDIDDRDCWDGAYPTGTYDPTNAETGTAGSYLPECMNRFDDDGDFQTDYPFDTNCATPLSPFE